MQTVCLMGTSRGLRDFYRKDTQTNKIVIMEMDAHPCTNSPDHECELTKYCTVALKRVFEVNW